MSIRTLILLVALSAILAASVAYAGSNVWGKDTGSGYRWGDYRGIGGAGGNASAPEASGSTTLPFTLPGTL